MGRTPAEYRVPCFGVNKHKLFLNSILPNPFPVLNLSLIVSLCHHDIKHYTFPSNSVLPSINLPVFSCLDPEMQEGTLGGMPQPRGLDNDARLVEDKPEEAEEIVPLGSYIRLYLLSLSEQHNTMLGTGSGAKEPLITFYVLLH